MRSAAQTYKSVSRQTASPCDLECCRLPLGCRPCTTLHLTDAKPEGDGMRTKAHHFEFQRLRVGCSALRDQVGSERGADRNAEIVEQ